MPSKRVLYIGLDPCHPSLEDQITHFPLIQIVPVPLAEVKTILKEFSHYTHILLTSKSAVNILIPYLEDLGFTNQDWANKTIAAVGQATAKTLQLHGIYPSIIAKEETAEGLVHELKSIAFKNAHVFWPHSKLARPLLSRFFCEKNILFSECILYNTIPIKPSSLPDLHHFDEILFTSPSTVDAFLNCFGKFPENASLKTIGPITQKYLKSKLAKLD